MEAQFFDSLYEGDSLQGVRLCMGLTGGDFWARLGGCSVLYRGANMGQIDFDDILGVVDTNAGLIGPADYIEHQSSTNYFYLVQRINGCGQREQTTHCAVKVAIDSDGDLASAVPNAVFAASGRRAEADKAELLWCYCPIEQAALPVCFNVYHDSGTGKVNYSTPIASVEYAGAGLYRYISDLLGSGEYLFVIRTEDSQGSENQSTTRINIEADQTNPDSVSLLTVTPI